MKKLVHETAQHVGKKPKNLLFAVGAVIAICGGREGCVEHFGAVYGGALCDQYQKAAKKAKKAKNTKKKNRKQTRKRN